MNLKVYEDSTNYTAQVVKLPNPQSVSGLDNLVSVNIQGNNCLIGKDSNPDILYLFFPAETQLSHEFLKMNNLYRHSELNQDQTKKGFFEDNRRVKAIKFKGIISSGFVIPLDSLSFVNNGYALFNAGHPIKVGDEFNEFYGVEICKKYIRKFNNPSTNQAKTGKLLDRLVDSKMCPEHFDTSHLLKYCDRIDLNDYIAVTYKLHGTSARYYNTLVKRKLNWVEKLAKFFGAKIETEKYDYVCASRRMVKSVSFEELPDKNHYYDKDLWSKIGKEYFQDKLNHGEAVYCEIIGKDYNGRVIQGGYTYGLEKPEVYIYRISNINSQGIEIDLPYHQMKERANQLGVKVCPELFYGNLREFIRNYWEDAFGNIVSPSENLEWYLNKLFYEKLLEQPSILDPSVIEEGFCIRIDKYPKPNIYKIKSKKFLEHETKQKDKEVVDIEEEQSVS